MKLKYYDICKQMTNHKENKCLKHTLCPRCNSKMTCAVDSITGKFNPHLWHCSCRPDLTLSIG